MADSPEKKARITENMWLATLPLAGTYLAFVFQSSYLSYFGVPASLIEIDIPKIVLSMVAISIAAVVFIAIFGLVSALVDSENPIIKIIGRDLLITTFFLPFIIVGFQVFSARQIATYVVIMLGLAGTSFLPPAQKTDENKPYLQRLREQESRYDDALKEKPRNTRELIGTSVLGPFSLILFCSIYVAMLGGYCASVFGGKTFLKSRPDALYVGKTGESYIFTIVDPSTNTFKDSILIVNVDEDHPIELVAAKNRPQRRN